MLTEAVSLMVALRTLFAPQLIRMTAVILENIFSFGKCYYVPRSPVYHKIQHAF